MWGLTVDLPNKEEKNSNFKNKFLNARGLIGGLVVLSLLVVFMVSTLTRPNALNIIIDGQVLAAAKDMEQVELVMEGVTKENQVEGLPMSCISSIEYEPVRVPKEEILEDEELAQLFRENLVFHYGAIALAINGETKVILENKETAEKVVETITNSFLPDDADNINVLEVEIVEEIEYVPVEVDVEEIIAFDEAVELLKYGEEKVTYYEVEEGDSFWTIAQKQGLSVAELEEANPEVGRFLQIGQQIRLVKPEPAINVKVVYEHTAEETIPYSVKKVNSDSLWRGQQKVQEPGSVGKKEVTYLVTETNGLLADKEILNEVVIKEPTDKVVQVGTRLLAASRGGGGSGVLGWPLRGAITSPYGYRNNPSGKGRNFHSGIDINGNTGDPIYAAEAGRVTFSGWQGGYGNLIIIDHGDGVTTYYAHCSSRLVGVGTKVNRGDVIARVGSTGNSTGPHLHFEVRVNGKTQNPMNYLR